MLIYPSPGPARHPPEQIPPGADTPSGADPTGDQVPPEQTPPCAMHAGRYGQQAGGMHPAGMQSSCIFFFKKKDLLKYTNLRPWGRCS